MRNTLKTLVACLIAGAWCVVTVAFILATRLIQHDEETGSIWPAFAIYAVFTAITGAGVWRLCKTGR